MNIGPQSTTTTYLIDYAQAVSALDKIGVGIAKYNTVVKQAKRDQDELKKSTESVLEATKKWEAGIKQIKDSNDKWIQGMKNLSLSQGLLTNDLSSLAKSMNDIVRIKEPFGPWVAGLDKMAVAANTMAAGLARLKQQQTSAMFDEMVQSHGPIPPPNHIPNAGRTLGTDSFQQGLARMREQNDGWNKLSQQGREAMDQLGKANDKMIVSNNRLTGTWVTMRIAIGALISRGVSFLITSFAQTGREAIELSKRIAELQTITIDSSDGILKSAKNTAQWKGELQSLSRTFGIPTLQTTEALYQALSNQVVNAGNATSFMAEEMKLAITAVSSLDQAVSVTSTVINAYHKETSEAARINAVLFKAVDLGRFRLEELGSGFGKTAILAHELGVTFEEQAGSLALLTRLGLNADTAQTLMVNVLTHLIKPTKDMTALFDKWGVTSGQAAIQTFGFADVIKKLAEETSTGGDQMKELGTIFQDVRAIIGAQGLVSNFGQLKDTIDKVSDATKQYNKAFALSLEATGRKAEIELEKLRQQFLNTFGQSLVEAGLIVAKAFGGADKALTKLLGTVRIAIEAYLAYRAALIAIEVSQGLFNISAGKTTFFLSSASAAANTTTTSLVAMTAAEAAATAGITLLVVGVAELIAEANTMQQRLESSFNALRSDKLEESRKILEGLTESIDEFARSTEKNNDRVFQTYARFAASIKAVNNTLVEKFEKDFAKINKSMVKGLEISSDVLEKKLKFIDDVISRAGKNLDEMNRRAIKIKEEMDAKGFEAGLVGVTPDEAIARTIARKRRLDEEAVAALRRGEVDLSDELFRRSERLMKDAESRIEAFKKKILADTTEIRTRISTTGARSVTVDDGTTRSTAFTTAPGRPRISRNLPGVGSILRTAPRSGISVTHREEIVDTERLAALERTLLDLRLSAEAVEGRKLSALKEGIALTEKVKVAEEKRRAATAASLEEFKKAVAAIDAFDIKKSGIGALKEFSGLLSSAEAAGKAAGLSPTEQFQFLRQAAAQKILLERQTAATVQADALKAVKEGLDKAKALKEAADKDFIDKSKTTADKTLAFTTQNAEVSARLRSEFVRPGFGFGRILTRTPEAENAKDELLKSLDKFDRLNNDLKELEKTGGNTATVLGLIATEQKKINDQIVAFSKLNGVKRNTTTPTPKKDKLGVILDEKGNPINAGIEASAAAAAKLQADIAATALAKKNFDEAKVAIDRLSAQISLLPKEFHASGDAATEAATRTVTAAQAINKVYDETLAKLREIQKIQENLMRLKLEGAAALAEAGPIVPRAFGGYGTDRGLIAASSGEMIMNRLAVRQYAPLLNAFNHSFPGRNSGQGGNVTMGDITIQTHTSTTTGQALDMGRQLQRLVAQGLLSF